MLNRKGMIEFILCFQRESEWHLSLLAGVDRGARLKSWGTFHGIVKAAPK